MRFVKMQGAGNDYVYVDCFSQDVADPAGLARRISDRHFGVGGDGLILILPSQVADVRMRMFNADGGEAEMCGNGVRCLGKYVHDHERSAANPLRVETAVGIRSIELRLDPAGKVAAATVDMGQPILDPEKIPVGIPQQRLIDLPIRPSQHAFKMTCVSMGNPHAVIFVDDVAAVALERVGPELEHHPLFPQGVNVHFVQVHSPAEVTARTWERGSGATLACGTGACATTVAAAITGRVPLDREVCVSLPGGDLWIMVPKDLSAVYMTGPAERVLEGETELI